jgi:hypothetical protein
MEPVAANNFAQSYNQSTYSAQKRAVNENLVQRVCAVCLNVIPSNKKECTKCWKKIHRTSSITFNPPEIPKKRQKSNPQAAAAPIEHPLKNPMDLSFILN